MSSDVPGTPDSPDSPDSPEDSSDSADGPNSAAELDPERPSDGLDLARAAARAASRAPGGPKRKTYKQNKSSWARRGKGGISGAHPDDRDPQLLGSALERLVGNQGWETDLRVQGVFGRWADLVGAEIASHCTPESLVDGKLVVRTDSTAWATQLRLLAASLVKRLNVELGHGTVLQIDVLGPHGPTWKKGPRSAGGRGPRDTYG